MPASRLWVLSAAICAGWFMAREGQAADDLAARRARVAGMTVAEKQQLLAKRERFAALKPEEQQRLRRLQEDIDRDPQGDKLRQVLERYHVWLTTLSPAQRAELLDLPPDERVERIKTLKQQQAAQPADGLTGSLPARRPQAPQAYPLLMRFWQSLPSQKKDELSKLSREQLVPELRRLYAQQFRATDRPRRARNPGKPKETVSPREPAASPDAAEESPADDSPGDGQE